VEVRKTCLRCINGLVDLVDDLWSCELCDGRGSHLVATVQAGEWRVEHTGPSNEEAIGELLEGCQLRKQYSLVIETRR
jgi:hypothetical protein